MKKAKEILDKRLTNRVRLEKEAPELFYGFRELMKAYYKRGALSVKYKELMAVTAAVATCCAPSLAHHINNAIALGASRKEIIEAATVGVEFGGGPAFVLVRDHLLDYMDDLE
jgi:AhpD family alkylhydroperoxidase